MYDVGNRSTSGPGFSVSYSFIAGTTVIASTNQKVTVLIDEIKDLILGTQVHITATANADENLGYPNIVAAADGWNTGFLPFLINNSGAITFYSDTVAPGNGIYIMYHVMYTLDEIPG